MRFLNFIIICISALAIAAFFMPWVKGTGSLAKPIDDSTQAIQDIEPSGLIKGLIKTTTGVVDTLTEGVAPIKLKQTLAGYQIPLVDNKEIKKAGAVVYLLFALPVIVIICAVFSILGNRRKSFDLLVFLISFGVFILLFGQVRNMGQEGLFVKVQACIGFWLIAYSFLGISIAAFIKLLMPIKVAPSK